MLSEFIEQHQLTDAFVNTAHEFYVPLAKTLAEQCKVQSTPFFVGINGCQGSGKSTLASFIADYLKQENDLYVINLSLDDFYLSKQAREQLAETVHPLLATRGVPGTHDVEKLKHALIALKHGEKGCYLPKFNKATDDVMHAFDWPYVEGKPDLVLLEGWCWGITAQAHDVLNTPINALEQTHDASAIWRTYVNDQLASLYQPLYALFDYWVMLSAPSFDAVYQWRLEQEQKLIARVGEDNNQVMSPEQIQAFIQYFQRLTEHGLNTLPDKVNYQLMLDYDRHVKQVVIGN